MDATRLANRIGRDTALHALNRCLRRALTSSSADSSLSSELGASRRVADALDHTATRCHMQARLTGGCGRMRAVVRANA